MGERPRGAVQHEEDRTRLVRDALQMHLVTDVLQLVCQFARQQHAVLLYGYPLDDTSATIHPVVSYDPSTDRWQRWKRVRGSGLTRRTDSGAVISGCAYMCGVLRKHVSVSPYDTVPRSFHRCLHLSSWQWTDLPLHPGADESLTDHCLTSFKDHMYLYRSDHGFFRFLPGPRVWEPRAEPPGRGGVELQQKLVTLGERVYLLSWQTTSLQCYDPVGDSWSSCAPPQHRLDGYAVVASAADLYVCAGRRTRRSCFRYSPVHDRWAPVADLQHSRFRPTGVYIDGRVLVCGGCYEPSAESYDATVDQWTLVADMPVARTGGMAVVV
jgi:hypothetical protein